MNTCIICPVFITLPVVVCLQVSNSPGLFDSGHPDDVQGAREGVGTLAGHTGETGFYFTVKPSTRLPYCSFSSFKSTRYDIMI